MNKTLSLVSLGASLLVVGGLVASCTSPTLSLTPTAFASPTVQPGTPITPQTPTLYPYPPTAASTPSPSTKPHVEISASATTLQVSDTVTITGQAMGIGFPRFELYLDGRPVVIATYNGEVKVSYREGKNTNPALEFVSAKGTTSQAHFILRARGAGTVQARLIATGEIHYSGRVTWAGIWSDPMQITITDR